MKQDLFQQYHNEVGRITEELKKASHSRNYEEVRRLFAEEMYAAVFSMYQYDINCINGLREMLGKSKNEGEIRILEDAIRNWTQDKDDLRMRLINWDEEVEDRINKIKKLMREAT